MDIILSVFLGATSSLLVSLISNLLSKNKIMKIRNNVNNDIKTKGNKIFDKMFFSNVEIDLRFLCKYIELYFKNISSDNEVFIKVLKCNDINNAVVIYSNKEKEEYVEYLLDENTSMYSVMQTKDAYFNNNIQYFLKHGKPYFEQHKMWEDSYKSIMCFPIKKDDKIIGFLLIGLLNPLNELIDFKNIKDLLEKICCLISEDKMFIEASPQ